MKALLFVTDNLLAARKLCFRRAADMYSIPHFDKATQSQEPVFKALAPKLRSILPLSTKSMEKALVQGLFRSVLLSYMTQPSQTAVKRHTSSPTLSELLAMLLPAETLQQVKLTYQAGRAQLPANAKPGYLTCKMPHRPSFSCTLGARVTGARRARFTMSDMLRQALSCFSLAASRMSPGPPWRETCTTRVSSSLCRRSLSHSVLALCILQFGQGQPLASQDGRSECAQASLNSSRRSCGQCFSQTGRDSTRTMSLGAVCCWSISAWPAA